MENISIRSASTQAKVIGTIVSISGALIVVLYAGPPLLTPSSPSVLPNQAMIGSPQPGWVLGGFLLAVDYSLVAVWYIFQVIPNVFLLLLWEYENISHIGFSCIGLQNVWEYEFQKENKSCAVGFICGHEKLTLMSRISLFFNNSSRVSVICKIMSMSLSTTSNTNWRVIE